jgi:hypothetical protein
MTCIHIKRYAINKRKYKITVKNKDFQTQEWRRWNVVVTPLFLSVHYWMGG